MRFFPHPGLPGHSSKCDREETAWTLPIAKNLAYIRDFGRPGGWRSLFLWAWEQRRELQNVGLFPRELTSQTFLMFFPKAYPEWRLGIAKSFGSISHNEVPVLYPNHHNHGISGVMVITGSQFV